MNSFRFSGLIFLAILVGILFPLGPSAKPLIGLFLSLLLFLNFCRFDSERGSFVRWELVPALLLWIIGMPVLSRLIGFAFPPSLALGLYLVVITPAAMGSPVIVHFLRGNFELSVAFVMITALLTPLIAPLSLKLAWANASVSGWAIFGNVAGLIFVPLVAALIARRIKRIQLILAAATARSSEIFVLLVFSSVATVSDKLRTLLPVELILLSAATLLLAFLQFGLGYLIARERAVRLAISVGIGQKNTGLSVWIALHFFSPEAALAPVLYILAQHLVSGVMMAVSARLQSVKTKGVST